MESNNNSNNNKQRSLGSNQNQEVVLSSSLYDHPEDKAYVQRIRQRARVLRELASPGRSMGDNVSLTETLSTLSTNSSAGGGGKEHHHHPHHHHKVSSRVNHPRSRDMSPPQYTIFEDELQSRAAQSSYISRPIDVDSMQEYEEEEEELNKPPRVELMDDSRTASTYSASRAEDDDTRSRATYASRPIDVDSVLEYDPEEYGETETKSEKNTSSNGFYEGESLLEYSSDDDTIDFENGLSCNTLMGLDAPELKVSSLKQSPPKAAIQQEIVSVDLVGPIHLDTSYLLTVAEDEIIDEASFREWEFPILDEREIDRELVGYIEGFEPYIEDLPPRLGGRKQSDATSTRSSNTRVTFEI